MVKILKVKSISIWIFLIPFIAVNACLIISTHYTELFKDGQAIYNSIQFFPTSMVDIYKQNSKIFSNLFNF